ncbi:hypothetical protein [Flavobacterium sp.]|uniref:hypothetical protein n=1 Tax=Flavobacterium sp. TaxID=239 RepID=UPI0025DC5321|nr:hypothetical protein [Flavobacterium sp.]
MKTKILTFLLLIVLSISKNYAQDRTTVTATSSDISDNLDLKAVASIFGDSRDLNDFERRLNDPKIQISNLDLNEDNQVDYLRVIETIERNTHLIVIQSVLGRDTFQDVATIEVQRDRHNNVQVQVVGDVYMYGSNYIYEPVYVTTPVIYNSFWTGNYHPYYSSWNWGYYPSYYYAWSPFPIFRYRNHIGICINNYNYYNYVSYRRCQVAYNLYRGRRCNGYENRYLDRSFGFRNSGYSNSYDLNQHRILNTVASRNEVAVNSSRNFNSNLPRINNTTSVNASRSYVHNISNSRAFSNPRNSNQQNNIIVTQTPRNSNATPRSFSNQAYQSPRNLSIQEHNTRNFESIRNPKVRTFSNNRSVNSVRNENSSRGNRRI